MAAEFAQGEGDEIASAYRLLVRAGKFLFQQGHFHAHKAKTRGHLIMEFAQGFPGFFPAFAGNIRKGIVGYHDFTHKRASFIGPFGHSPFSGMTKRALASTWIVPSSARMCALVATFLPRRSSAQPKAV